MNNLVNKILARTNVEEEVNSTYLNERLKNQDIGDWSTRHGNKITAKLELGGIVGKKFDVPQMSFYVNGDKFLSVGNMLSLYKIAKHFETIEKESSDREDEIERLEGLIYVRGLGEGMHQNTKVRGTYENAGSRKIRLTIKEAARMCENFMNPDHCSPNPKDADSMQLMVDAKYYLEESMKKIKKVKDKK